MGAADAGRLDPGRTRMGIRTPELSYTEGRMCRMEGSAPTAPIDHRERVTAFTGMFAATLAGADEAARLPGYGSWTVADLGAHLGAVHRWAAEIVEGGVRTRRVNRPELDVPVLDHYRDARERLLAVLAATDPERACWTLHRTDRTVRFWHRRQAFETLVHLWDLRAAIDPGAGLDDVDLVVCADGVQELYEVFVPRASAAERPTLPGSVALVATDADRSWTIGPEWTFEPGAGADAAATVRAPAAALLLWAWRRPSLAAPSVDGDQRVVAALRRAQVVP